MWISVQDAAHQNKRGCIVNILKISLLILLSSSIVPMVAPMDCGGGAGSGDDQGDRRGTKRTADDADLDCGGGKLKKTRYFADASTSVDLLMGAAATGDIETIRVLKECYLFDVNRATNHSGSTALMIAAQHGHLDVVRFLLELPGADINSVNSYGSTALMASAFHGHLDVVRLLAQHPDMHVNQENRSGWTALMAAASNGHLNVITFLVDECGARAHLQDSHGWTALMVAVSSGYLEVASFLARLSSLAVQQRNHHGLTPLIIAAQSSLIGSEETRHKMIELLFSCGAHITRAEWTRLHPEMRHALKNIWMTVEKARMHSCIQRFKKNGSKIFVGTPFKATEHALMGHFNYDALWNKYLDNQNNAGVGPA